MSVRDSNGVVSAVANFGTVLEIGDAISTSLQFAWSVYKSNLFCCNPKQYLSLATTHEQSALCT